MQFKNLVLTALSAKAILAAVNEPCVGSGGVAGVCISTSACSAAGGSSITGFCPSDPAGIRCCFKKSCSNGSSGNCRWQSDCAGSSVSNQCPGPSQMKCCSSAATGFGGYSAPKIPAVASGGCTKVAVDGAKAVVDNFPGRVREIGCKRTCACTSTPESDHCCGKAIDFMCSDGGGVPTMSGRSIAQWIMNKADDLKVKYIIWGQKIWYATQATKPWVDWNDMEDRGSITTNHWDHVHVSFK
ncbi:hypothetical protein OQA88_5798 [Cercophora sp. LCS_1]